MYILLNVHHLNPGDGEKEINAKNKNNFYYCFLIFLILVWKPTLFVYDRKFFNLFS